MPEYQRPAIRAQQIGVDPLSVLMSPYTYYTTWKQNKKAMEMAEEDQARSKIEHELQYGKEVPDRSAPKMSDKYYGPAESRELGGHMVSIPEARRGPEDYLTKWQPGLKQQEEARLQQAAGLAERKTDIEQKRVTNLGDYQGAIAEGQRGQERRADIEARHRASVRGVEETPLRQEEFDGVVKDFGSLGPEVAEVMAPGVEGVRPFIGKGTKYDAYLAWKVRLDLPANRKKLIANLKTAREKIVDPGKQAATDELITSVQNKTFLTNRFPLSAELYADKKAEQKNAELRTQTQKAVSSPKMAEADKIDYERLSGQLEAVNALVLRGREEGEFGEPLTQERKEELRAHKKDIVDSMYLIRHGKERPGKKGTEPPPEDIMGLRGFISGIDGGGEVPPPLPTTPPPPTAPPPPIEDRPVLSQEALMSQTPADTESAADRDARLMRETVSRGWGGIKAGLASAGQRLSQGLRRPQPLQAPTGQQPGQYVPQPIQQSPLDRISAQLQLQGWSPVKIQAFFDQYDNDPAAIEAAMMTE